MRDYRHIPGYRVVVVTLDSHALGSAQRVLDRVSEEMPGLTVEIHAAAEWAENPEALEEAKIAVAHADIIVANLIFFEDQVNAILPALEARRPDCYAMIGVIADPQIVALTKMG